MTRKILIAVGAALALVIAALLVGPSFVDWNRYKPMITEQVAAATGRQLAIDGDISLALLPVPKLSVEGVRFANAEGGSTAEMATLESLSVRVGLLPLLSGKVQVDSVTLVRPNILLEKLPDGRGNWELSMAPAAESGTAPSTGAGGGGFDFSFDSIRIEQGTLVYRDAAAGTEQRIEGLDAEIGVSSLAGPFQANGKATYQGIAAGFDALIGKLEPNKPTAVDLALRLGEPESKLEFAGSLTQTEAGFGIDGKLAGGGDKLSALLAALAPDAGGGMKLLDQKFQVAGDIVASDTAGALNNFSVQLGDLEVKGAAEIGLGQPLSIKAKLQVGRLDLDALMANLGAGEGAATSEPAAVPAPAGAPSSFALPEGITAELEVGIEAISYNGGVVNQASLAAKLDKGELTLTKLSALLPGNSDLSLAGKLASAEGVPSFTGALELNSDNLRGLLDWLKVALPDIPAERLRKMSLASRVTATPNQIQIADMDMHLDASRIAGGVVVALPNGERKALGLGVGLAIDQINLDGYMPKPAAAATGGGSAAKPAGGLPLEALKPLAPLNANVELKIGSLTLNDQVAKGFHLDATLQGGNLAIRDVSVKEFAGGSGNLKGTITDLGGTPRLDSQFSLRVGDATRALTFAGMENAPPKLGKLSLDGKLSGGQQDVAYDIAFNIAGIGAAGKATGTASGLDGGIPLIDADFDIQAKNAGPLLEMAGLAGRGPGEARRAAAQWHGAQQRRPAHLQRRGRARRHRRARRLRWIDHRPQGDAAGQHQARRHGGEAGGAARALRRRWPDGGQARRAVAQGHVERRRRQHGARSGARRARRRRHGQRHGQGGGAADGLRSRDHREPSGAEAARRGVRAGRQGRRPEPRPADPVGEGGRHHGSGEDQQLRPQGGSERSRRLARLRRARRRPADGEREPHQQSLRSHALRARRQRRRRSGGSGTGGGERWSKEPLDLSALDSMDADITATVQRFVMGETRIDNLDAHLVLKDGVLTIDKMTGNTYGGAVDLTGQLTSRGTPTFTGRMNAANLNSTELAGGGFLANRLQGPVSLTTDLTSNGNSMADLVGNLNGTGNLDGTITVLGKIEQQVGSVGLNLLGALAQQKLGAAGTQIQGLTQLADSAYSAFIGVPNSLTGDFLVRNGTVNTDNLALANANARAIAQGAANLPAWTMDMIATIFRAPDLNAPFLELSLNGLLDSPNTKFKGFAPVSAAPTGTDLLQQVLPGTTGGATTTSPGGILQQVLPGTTGGATTTQPAARRHAAAGAAGDPRHRHARRHPDAVPGAPGATGTAAPIEESVPQTGHRHAGDAGIGRASTHRTPAPRPCRSRTLADRWRRAPPAPTCRRRRPTMARRTKSPPVENGGSSDAAPGSGGAAPGGGGVQPGTDQQQPLNNLLQNLIQPSP